MLLAACAGADMSCDAMLPAQQAGSTSPRELDTAGVPGSSTSTQVAQTSPPSAGVVAPPPVTMSTNAGAAGAPAQPSAAGTASVGTAGAGASAAGSAAPGMAGAAATMQPCRDSCPRDPGVSWVCRQRFMYGLNYAWHTFAADFGGNRAWDQAGISAEPAVASELAMLAANGVSVVRWWLWPDFRGDGVSFDAADTPQGLGGTALADLARALELAEQNDLYLMLTLFSFDNFRATRMESDLRVRGIQPIVLDDAKRRALMDNVVAPLARAVASSPHKTRVIAWDVINEPEWAVTGPSLYGGDPDFDPMMDLESVTHAQMETFIRDVMDSLRANSDALVTVGATAIKWAHAWSQLDLDFYQFHMYDWINMYWPYDKSPEAYGLNDKPLVMGEFPVNGLMGVSYSKLLQSWFGNGYAGALGWAFTDSQFNDGDYTELKAFADAQPCETHY